VTQASLASTPPCPARSPHTPLNHRQTFFRHVSLCSGAEFLSHPGNSQQISFCEIHFQTAGSSPSSDPLLTRQSRPQAEQAGERHGAGTDETRSGDRWNAERSDEGQGKVLVQAPRDGVSEGRRCFVCHRGVTRALRSRLTPGSSRITPCFDLMTL